MTSLYLPNKNAGNLDGNASSSRPDHMCFRSGHPSISLLSARFNRSMKHVISAGRLIQGASKDTYNEVPRYLKVTVAGLITEQDTAKRHQRRVAPALVTASKFMAQESLAKFPSRWLPCASYMSDTSAVYMQAPINTCIYIYVYAYNIYTIRKKH